MTRSLFVTIVCLFVTGCGEPPAPEKRPFVSGVSPAHVRTGATFTISGGELGTGGAVRLPDGKTLSTASWTSTGIVVKTDESSPIGQHQITVVPKDGPELGPLDVRISQQPPLLAQALPDTAKAGDQVVVSGKRLGAQKGSRLLVLGAEVTQVKSWTDTAITFTLPPLQGEGGERVIVLETETGKSNLLPFSYLPPFAERLIPDPALPEKVVTLRGHDFGTKKGEVLFDLPPKPAEILSWADREISLRLPKDATGEIQCRVVNENGRSLPLLVNILTPPPQGRVEAPLGAHVTMALDPYDRPFLFTFDISTMKFFLTQWTNRGWATSPMLVKIGKTTSEMPKVQPDLEAKIQKVMDDSRKVKNKDQKQLEAEIKAVVEAEAKTAPVVKEPVAAAGAFASVQVDKAQTVRLTCFQMGGQKLVYGERELEQPEWTYQHVNPADGQREGLFSALKTDSKGKVHVVYMNAVTNNMFHAVRQDGKFVTEPVDPDPSTGMATTLALDGQDRPHLAYLDFKNFDLKYAFHDGKAFKVERVDSAGWTGDMPSMVLDGEDNPVIAFMKRDDTGMIPMSVRVATRKAGAWTVEVVEEGPGIGLQPILRRDDKGRLHLVYHDTKAKALRYAVKDGGAWKKTSIPVPDMKTEIEPGRFTASLGTDGLLRLAYWTTKELQYKVLALP